MIEEALSRLRQTANRVTGLKLRESDLDIMEALFERRKQKQYDLEKRLKESRKAIAHSSVTGKLERLCRDGLVDGVREADGFMYYELSPMGVSWLIFRGRIPFERALTYIEENQVKYLELLTRLHPNLIERLERQPPWFAVQLTPDLWVIYDVPERSVLRKQTIEFFLALSKGDSPKPVSLEYGLQPLCAHRVEVAGKAVCLKQRIECVYRPREVAKCKVLNEQMLKELKALSST